MAGTATTEQVSTADGVMDAHLVVPEVRSGAGVLVLQEIFGVNDYVKQAARRLADLGYVALAPDLYWRTDPGLALDHDEASMGQAMAASRKLDRTTAVADAVAALDHLRGLPGVTGKVGVLGFCLGGALAYGVAVEDAPDAAVCYYGSGIADALDAAPRITCPVLFQFGGADQFIPREQIDRVAELAAAREGMDCHIHEGAGHAFDNPAPMFHHPAAAAAAWGITRDFLAHSVGSG